MLKHVGLHNAQKITIVLHQMPAEDHMCLIMYDQKLPPRYYDAVKKVLNSPAGQEAKDFATALEGAKLDDDRQLARVLFTEGHLKKVPCNQVFATPLGYESANKIKLNELNAYTAKIAEGGEALQKLSEFDANKGMHKKARKENLGEGTAVPVPSTPTPQRPVAAKAVPEVAPVPQFEQQQMSYSHEAADPKAASVELHKQGENLKTVALQLLHQAKLLSEKAETLFPSAPKRGRGRPVGTGKKIAVKTTAK